MKIQNVSKALALSVVAGLLVLTANAQAQTASAPPQLSYGVSEIAQLAQAKVGDSTIIAYIKNSGVSYGLDANQIVYLRQQGVSDAVITTMLSQPKPVVATATATATVPVPTTSPPQVAPATVATVPAAPTTVVAPAVTYVQTVPTTTYYYAPQPYYPSYYGGWAPNISLAFGFGGYYGGHGGYYGGWHGGGGWHGHH